MRVLVTRPEADAEALVAELAARGHEALVEPLIVIKPAAPQLPLDLDGVQALMFTSANGVRAFTAIEKSRGLRVFAVGDATAETARGEGFTQVESAEGTVEDLVELVARHCDPATGSLFHGAGSRVAGDLKGSLEAAGFTVRRVVLYDARPVQSLSEAARSALGKGRLDAVVFFSPRTAGTFARLVATHALEAACLRCHAVCLSAAVAEELAVLDWAAVHVAVRPERQALLASLDGIQLGQGGTRQEDEGRREGMTEDSASKDSKPGEQEAATADAAHQVVAAFGGIRPMANKLGLAVSTVQGWKQRNAIPASRHPAIMTAARDSGIALDEATLAASDHPDGEPAPAASRKTKSKAKANQRIKPAAVPTPERPEDAAPKAEESTGAIAPDEAPKAEAPKAARAETTGSAIPASPLRPAAGRTGDSSTRAWLGGLVLGALVMVLGFGGAVLTRDTWLPALGGDVVITAPDGRFSELDQRLNDQGAALSDIESRLAALPSETGSETSPAVTAALQALQSDAGDLAERFKRLEQELATAAASSDQLAGIAQASEALAGRIANLEARLGDLDRLESEINILAGQVKSRPSATAGDVAVMLALVQLRERLSGPGPFGAELDLLRGLLGDDADLEGLLAPLDRHAANGVPSLETLRRDFAEVADEVVVAAAGGEGDGVIAGMLRRLSDVVTVRPVGEAEGDEAGAIVARTEHKLQNGDLAGALTELDGLSGAAAEAAAEWRTQAAARLSIETAVAAVVAQVIDRLAPADG